MRKVLQIALNQAAQTRDRYLQRQVERQEQGDRKMVMQASYVGYDADTGLHSAELPDGSLIQAVSLTTMGLAPGDRVAVGRSGLYQTIKAMPR